MREAATRGEAGVGEAPRHEVAGGSVLAMQRALWRFDRGAGGDWGGMAILNNSLRACAVPFLNASTTDLVVAQWPEWEPQRSIVPSDASVGDAG
jgi:hypothetical protein